VFGAYSMHLRGKNGVQGFVKFQVLTAASMKIRAS
jgi:hypothetical protein